LTRRLVDVTQEIITTEQDCNTDEGIWIDAGTKERTGEGFAERVMGRVAAKSVTHPKTGEVIVARGEMITEDNWKLAEAAQVEKASAVRSRARRGTVCARCATVVISRAAV
jgi:DNA-directed RNA polymerase subunit beta'